jgi:F0F1-type ATP synthase assembly protein I
MMPGADRNGGNQGGDYARYVGLGFTFVFIIALFTAGGYVLDRLLGTLPLLLLAGLVLGFAGALYYLFRTLGGVDGG